MSELMNNTSLPHINSATEEVIQAEFENLKSIVLGFQSKLEYDYEVGITLVSFGEVTTMHVVKITYVKPDIFVFDGYVNGSRSVLVQHHSQLNLLLCAVLKPDLLKPPNRIGFDINS